MSERYDWYGIYLGHGRTASLGSSRIQRLFATAYAKAGQPFDMALFSHLGDEDELTLYLTPAAGAFARALSEGVAPCAKPNHKLIGLLHGNARALGFFFPEHRRR